MSGIDLTGLGGAVVIGTLVAALGAGIDNLLLQRQVSRLNLLALKWWDFFDSIRIVDLPRIAITIFMRGKDRLLGKRLNLMFSVRAAIISLVLTAIALPGGRAASLAILDVCTVASGGQATGQGFWWYFRAGWGYTGWESLAVLTPLNVVFDLLTIYITTILLGFALRRGDYFLITLVLLDIIACFILIEGMIFASDFQDIVKLAHAGFGTGLRNMIELTTVAGCALAHMILPRLLYIGTIILPTVIYLVMIVGLFVLRETFKIFRWLAMHLFEKSVEDKKTIFAHLGVTIGLLVACGKAVQEMVKLLTAP